MTTINFQTLPHASAADAQRAATGMQWCKISDASLIPVARTFCKNIYLRPYLPDDGDCPNGAAWAQQITVSIGHVWPAAIVMRNEISADVGQVAQYQAWRQTLRANGYRGLCVYGSFAVGTPDFGQWPAIVKAFRDSPPDALDLHEYFDLTTAGSSPWWALRHVELLRRGLIPATWPLFIGECGSDAIGAEDVQHRRGWQNRGKLSADAMITQLRVFAAGCAPSVVATFVFGDGGTDSNWDSYRTFGTPVESYIRSTNSTPTVENQTIENPASDTKGTPMSPNPTNNPAAVQATSDQGNTLLCWDYSVMECVQAAGGSVDVDALYQAVKGVPYSPPGQAATFSELVHAITYAAGANGWQVQWYGSDGRIDSWAAFQACLGTALWYMVAGVQESVLIAGQNYGHFEAVIGRWTAPDGTLMVNVADSYGDEDTAGHSPAYPLSEYEQAMQANWDTATDAVAFRFALPASVAPSAPATMPAPVATPAPATMPADEAEAYAYYTQDHIGIDRSHALWSVTLLPLYRRAKALKAANDPLADLVMPGTLAGPETGARWGGTRPAAIVRLTNQTVGAYLDASGTWRPYRPEGA